MSEAAALAALERTLVGAAARQAHRRRLRRRRLIATLAVTAPLMLAAGSVASTQGLFRGVDQQFSALRDDRLVSRAAPSPGFFDALGALPGTHGRRSWTIAGRRVTGYTAANGSFCFLFGPLTGGCIHPGVLSAARPVSFTVDHGPGTFRIYGLAYDGVTGIGLRTGGVTRTVVLERNAVYFEDASLADAGRRTGTLIVHLRGGGIAYLPFHVSDGSRPTGKVLPLLPGVMPAGNTAA